MESTVAGTGGRTTAPGAMAYTVVEAISAMAKTIFAGKLFKRFTL
jgi:hypothetical protein